MVNYIENADQAALLLRQAQRILVIGCSGSGKSTLSQKIAALKGLAYISMDRDVYWLPGWKDRPRPEAMSLIEGFVAGPAWIMDGTSPRTMPLRLPRTDIVLWLRPHRFVSLYGVIRRWLHYRGRTRPEMADGCPERISREFLSYIWNFEKTQSPRLVEMFEQYGPGIPVVIIRSR